MKYLFYWVFMIIAGVAAAEDAALPASLADNNTANFVNLTRVATEYDAGIAATGALLDAEKETLPQARSRLFPQLSFSAQNTWNRQKLNNAGDNEREIARQSLQLTQPLLNLPNLYQYKGAKYAVKARRHAYRESLQQLLLQVIMARLSLHTTADRLILLQKRRKNIKAQLQITQKSEAGGIGTYLDVVLVEAELESVRADLQGARSDWQTAQNALVKLTGLTVEVLPQLKTDFVFIPPPPLTVLAATMTEHNPSLARRRMQVEELLQQWRGAQAAVGVPSVDLIASHSWQEGDNAVSAVGIQVQMELFSGGRQTSQARQLAHQHLSARHSLTNVQRQLAESLHSLHGVALAAVGRGAALQAAIKARRASLEKNRIAWREGVRLAADVLRAEEELFDAELQRRNLIYSYLSSLAQIQSITGGIDELYLQSLDEFFGGGEQ